MSIVGKRCDVSSCGAPAAYAIRFRFQKCVYYYCGDHGWPHRRRGDDDD